MKLRHLILLPRVLAFALVIGCLAGPCPSFAISPDNAPAEDNSVEAELASFQVHDDFEVSLFADESLGIANPIAIHWDPQGRLWVLCTLAYSQLRPGEQPDDKIIILEDTDGDGRADQSTVFADGLNMPTGFALGHGGVYLAEETDIVFLRDSDGDDQSDQRRILLTGFGTGDTHQNISNLVFDSGGYLYFTQGLHAFSQVETPWGVARGDTAGFWRFDPRTTRLHPFGFPSMTSQNPCGAALDRWGALFIKSNGPRLCFATPGLIPTTHSRELMQFAQVGQTPGKSMGVDIVESAHLPDWIQGHAVIAGYFAREVSAIPLVEDGAGFAVSPPERLVYGGHASFRPVDIRQGPDGAIYVVDWFNPIINHYQVSLRHPDRDYSHGRIWRISAKGRPPATPPSLAELEPTALFEQLRSGERWTREQAKRFLSDHPKPEDLTSRLGKWIETLDPKSPADSHALVEAAGVMESHGVVLPGILDRLQNSTEPRARAVAARIISRTTEPIPDAESRLAELLADEHPRPRLEAVVACANRPSANSLKLALAALDNGEDRFVDYALGQAVFALEEFWLTALKSGQLSFEKPEHLAYALEVYGGTTAADLTRSTLAEKLSDDARTRLLAVLAKVGNPKDLSTVLAEAAMRRSTGSGDPEGLLQALMAAWETRKVKPEAPFDSPLGELIDSKSEPVRVAAIQLAGIWKATGLAGSIADIAQNAETPDNLRSAAFLALGRIQGKAAVPLLAPLAEDKSVSEILRQAARDALAEADLTTAGETIARLVKEEEDPETLATLLAPLLNRGGGTSALAKAFESSEEPLDTELAQELLNVLNRAGRTDAKLTPLLNRAAGIQSAAPDYDPERVKTIVNSVKAGEGNSEKGREIYLRAQLACVACHRVGDEGGVIGPALSNVGAGMPLDQIVESVLWPDRQIKEGFQAISLTTTSGKVITGYLERESEEMLFYRNATAPWILPLEQKDIAERQKIPTLMPAGLTNSLTEEEFRDLIAYLASLKG